MSLVNYNDESKRYKLHDLTRLFASHGLPDAERYATQLRYTKHYLEVIRTADNLHKQRGDSVMQGRALFRLERMNIEHGQKWASENDAAQVFDDYLNASLRAIALCLHWGSDPRKWFRSVEDALMRMRMKNPQYVGFHLGILILGYAYFTEGETRKAIEFYEQALIIDRELGDRRGEGTDLDNLGSAYAALGETRKAIEFYEQRLVIAREIGDRQGEGYATFKMSLEFDKLGERVNTVKYADAALKILEAIEDPSAGIVRKKLEEWRGQGAMKNEQ